MTPLWGLFIVFTIYNIYQSKICYIVWKCLHAKHIRPISNIVICNVLDIVKLYFIQVWKELVWIYAILLLPLNVFLNIFTCAAMLTRILSGGCSSPHFCKLSSRVPLTKSSITENKSQFREQKISVSFQILVHIIIFLHHFMLKWYSWKKVAN